MVVTAMAMPKRPASLKVMMMPAMIDDGRQRRGFQRDRQALDHVGAVAGFEDAAATDFTGR